MYSDSPDPALSLNDKASQIALFESNAGSFTRKDFILANFIADNMQNFPRLTISELAAAVEVSEITISRFCKKLNLAGLQALKLHLAARSQLDSLITISQDSTLQAEDDPRTLAVKVFSKIQEGLQETLNLLDFAAVERTAHILLKAERILFFGYGNSSTICKDFATRFARFGMACEWEGDVDHQLTLAAVCRPKTAVVAVSYSGASFALLGPMKAAKENGASIILLSSHRNSMLSAAADEVLVGAGPEVHVNNMSSVSRLVFMAIGDVLYSRMSFLSGNLLSTNVKKMQKALSAVKA